MLLNASCTCPPIEVRHARAAALVGNRLQLHPASTLKYSSARCCMPPVFETAAFSWPGFAFASAMNSFRLFAGTEALTARMYSVLTSVATGRELQELLVLRVRVQDRVDDVSRRHEGDRLAVRRGALQRFAGDDVVASGPVVDDDLLPPRSGQLVADESRRDARRAARRVRNDEANRPIGIVLLCRGRGGEEMNAATARSRQVKLLKCVTVSSLSETSDTRVYIGSARPRRRLAAVKALTSKMNLPTCARPILGRVGAADRVMRAMDLDERSLRPVQTAAELRARSCPQGKKRRTPGRDILPVDVLHVRVHVGRGFSAIVDVI